VLRDDPDRLARWQAAIALQRLHDPGVVSVLIDATRPSQEPDVQTRAAAAVALGQYAEPRVLDALIATLDDPDLAVNAGARRSLRILTGHDAGYLPSDWVAWTRASDDPFADREMFIYPAFSRDPVWWERINPFIEVPNEVATRPAGMPAIGQR
jgi:HEAT repeat protein